MEQELAYFLVNQFCKIHLIMIAMAKIMEMEQVERNKVVMYLFNLV